MCNLFKGAFRSKIHYFLFKTMELVKTALCENFRRLSASNSVISNVISWRIVTLC